MFRRKKYIFAVKKSHRGRNIILGILAVLVVIGVAALVIYPVLRPINYSVTVEAGSAGVDAAAFRKNSQSEEPIQLLWGEGGEPDWNVPGEYQVKVSYGGKEYTGTVRVTDTVAPAAEAREVTWFVDDEGSPQPMDFVADVQDATQVTAKYKEEPDMTLVGSQEVTVILIDGGDNRTEILSKLTITDDQKPPVIYGAVDRLTYLGTAIPLDDGIAVVDDRDDAPALSVDASAVNFNEKGTYPVIYTAVDRAGNATKVETTLTVSYFRESAVKIDKLNAVVDELLAQIVDDSMTAEEKCRAVYDWAKTSVAWSTSGSDRTAWTKEAYRAIRWKAGDSFTTSALFHGCMIRLGYQDMMVQRSGSLYYWNLVNLGDGWYHVDCGRGSGAVTEPVFLLTDQELAKCSAEAGNGFYDFDHTLYPAASAR